MVKFVGLNQEMAPEDAAKEFTLSCPLSGGF
jgi:hypothetical protein